MSEFFKGAASTAINVVIVLSILHYLPEENKPGKNINPVIIFGLCQFFIFSVIAILTARGDE